MAPLSRGLAEGVLTRALLNASRRLGQTTLQPNATQLDLEVDSELRVGGKDVQVSPGLSLRPGYYAGLPSCAIARQCRSRKCSRTRTMSESTRPLRPHPVPRPVQPSHARRSPHLQRCVSQSQRPSRVPPTKSSNRSRRHRRLLLLLLLLLRRIAKLPRRRARSRASSSTSASV